jgi:hypothetical protein
MRRELSTNTDKKKTCQSAGRVLANETVLSECRVQQWAELLSRGFD